MIRKNTLFGNNNLCSQSIRKFIVRMEFIKHWYIKKIQIDWLLDNCRWNTFHPQVTRNCCTSDFIWECGSIWLVRFVSRMVPFLQLRVKKHVQFVLIMISFHGQLALLNFWISFIIGDIHWNVKHEISDFLCFKKCLLLSKSTDCKYGLSISSCETTRNKIELNAARQNIFCH